MEVCPPFRRSGPCSTWSQHNFTSRSRFSCALSNLYSAWKPRLRHRMSDCSVSLTFKIQSIGYLRSSSVNSRSCSRMNSERATLEGAFALEGKGASVRLEARWNRSGGRRESEGWSSFLSSVLFTGARTFERPLCVNAGAEPPTHSQPLNANGDCSGVADGVAMGLSLTINGVVRIQ